jgi:hypothetical protein
LDKLVRVKDCTYNELAKRGKWNDTMDSIIQQLLQQQQKNPGLDESIKNSQREGQPVPESNVQKSVEYVYEPFDNDDSNRQNHDRTSRVDALYAITGYRAKQDAEDPDEVIEKKRQRKRLVIPDCDKHNKEPQGAPPVGLQVKRQTAAGIHFSAVVDNNINAPQTGGSGG